ncbi:MAG TPA: hypothetical protein DCX41_02820 [Aequorivita sp.]|nr:hypothetical protein [Aequorivita sp.]
MKILFLILLIIHASIHLLGFLKAFGFAEIPQLPQHFSKTHGHLWLGVALSFAITAILFLLKSNLWFWIAIGAVVLPLAADAVWHFPEGDFVYGKFYLQDVGYNLGNPIKWRQTLFPTHPIRN